MGSWLAVICDGGHDDQIGHADSIDGIGRRGSRSPGPGEARLGSTPFKVQIKISHTQIKISQIQIKTCQVQFKIPTGSSFSDSPILIKISQVQIKIPQVQIKIEVQIKIQVQIKINQLQIKSKLISRIMLKMHSMSFVNSHLG